MLAAIGPAAISPAAPGATADFSTLTLSGTNTVHLNEGAAFPIGSLIFGDQANVSGWILDNNSSGTNTLDLVVYSGAPTITVNNQSATISAVLTGAQGFTLNGGGTLILSAANTYTGTTTISSGSTLQAGIASAIPSTSSVSIATTGMFVLNGFNQSIGSLTGAGNVTNNSLSNTNVTLTVGGDNTYQPAFSGVISNNTIAQTGTVALTKIGTGTLALSGLNTYTGATTISAGGIMAGLANTLPSASALSVTGALSLNGFSQSIGSITGAGVIVDTTTNTDTLTIGNDNTNPAAFTGTIIGNTGTLGLSKVGTGNQTISSSALNLVYFGSTSISGNGILTFSTNNNNMPFLSAVSVGSGSTLALGTTSQSIGSLTGAGSVTMAGGTGTLIVGNDNTSPPAFTGVLGSATATLLTKVGSGTLTFAGANPNTYTGATAVSGGALALDFSNMGTPTNLINSSSGLSVGSATLSVKGQNGAVTSQTFNNTLLIGGASMSINNNSATSTTVVLGNLTRNSTGTTVDFTFTSPGSFTTSKNNTATTILGGWATVAGTNWAVTGGSGTNPVTALGTYQSDNFGAGNDVTVTAADTPAAFTINSLQFNAAGGSVALAAASANTITSGGILVTSAVGAGGASIGGTGTLTSGNTTDLIVNQFDTAGAFTISAPITGSIGLTKSGPGTLILTGSSNFVSSAASSGNPITVNAGVLSISSDGIGSGASSQLGSTLGTATTGDIVLNGGTLLASASMTLNSNRGIALGPNLTGTGAGNIGFGGIAVAAGQTLNYNGAITNRSALDSLVVGSSGNTGTLWLGGTNSYTGATQIQFGTLQAGATGDINSSSAVQISSGANYVLNGFAQSIGSLTGAGNVANNYNGAAATLTIGSDNTSPPAFSGVISDGGVGLVSLSKTGTGRLILSGANTYTGTTAITGGILQMGIANGISYSTLLSSTVTVTTPGVFMLNGFNQTIGSLAGSGSVTNNSPTAVTLTVGGDNTTPGTFSGVISNATQAGSGALSLTKIGVGTLTFSGTNTYTGATTINAGGIQVGAAGSIPTLSAVVVNSGGTLDINGVSPSIGSLAGSGLVLDISTAATLTVGNDNTNTAFSGSLSNAFVNLGTTTNALSLTKVGFGTLTLSGTNLSSGAITVNGGFLQTGATNTLLSYPLATTSSTLTVGAGGTLVLGGFSQLAGSLAGSAGARVTNNSSTTDATLTIGFDNTSPTFSGVLSDTTAGNTNKLSLVKVGTGIETLAAGTATGFDTYSGAHADSRRQSDDRLGRSGDADESGQPTLEPHDRQRHAAGHRQGERQRLSGVRQQHAGRRRAGIDHCHRDHHDRRPRSNHPQRRQHDRHQRLQYRGRVHHHDRQLSEHDPRRLGHLRRRTTTWAVNSGTANGLGGNNITGLTVPTANTFSGDVLVTGTQTQSALTINSLMFNAGSATLALSGANVNSSGGILVTSAAGATAPIISGSGTLTSGNGSDLIVNDFDASGSMTISLPIADNGVTHIGLTKSGGGTLLLTGANTFSGQTTINAGVISFPSDASGTIGSLTTAPLGQSTTISINGGTLLANTSMVLNAGRSINVGPTVGVGSGTIAVGLSQTVIWGGTISTNTALDTVIFGSSGNTGIFYLSGASNYAGPTSVAFGQVAAAAANVFAGNSAWTVSSSTSPAVILNGYSQSIGSLAGSGNITNNSNNNATLTIGGNNLTPAVYSGVISNDTSSGEGILSLTKNGTGWLTLTNTNTYTGPTTINGGLLIAGTAGAISNTSFVTVGAAGTLVVNGQSMSIGTLSGSGKVTNNSNSAVTLTIGAGAAMPDFAQPAFSGVLSNWTLFGSGALSLTKTSPSATNYSTLVLSGANTYTGATSITTGGGIQAGAANTIPPFSAVTVTSPAALFLTNFSQSVGSITRTGTIVDTTPGGSVTLTIGNDNTTPTAFSGAIFDNTGTLGLTKVGFGNQSLSDSVSLNVYFGPTMINGGTLTAGALNTIPFLTDVTIASGATFAIGGNIQNIGSLSGAGFVTGSTTLVVGNNNAANTTFSGVISGGSMAITKVGSGTLTLAGPALSEAGASGDTYTGATSVLGGTLGLDFSNFALRTNLVTASSALRVGSATLAVKGAATGVTSQTFGSTTFYGGAGLTINANGGGGTTVALNGLSRSGIGSTADFSSTGTFTTTTANTATTILAGWATVGGTNWAVSSGSSPFTITALGTYQMDNFGAGNDVTVTTADPQALAFTINSLQFNASGGSVTLASATANTITSGGILVTSAVGAGGAAIGGAGTLSINTTTTSDLIIHQYDSAGTFTISAPISNGASTAGLTKSGPGTLVLSGSSTYTGQTTINAGIVSINYDLPNALASVAAPLGESGTLAINGGTLLAASTFRLNSNRTIQLGPALGAAGSTGAGNAGYGAISVASGQIFATGGAINNRSSLDSLVIGSAGNTGTLFLTSGSGYNGATQFNFGTLEAGATNAIGTSSALQMAGGTTFIMNGFGDSIGSLTGSGNITNNSGVSVTLTVGNDVTSPPVYSGIISNTTGSGTGFVSLTKTGAGRLILSGANTYGASAPYAGAVTVGGPTTISGGFLQAGAVNTIPQYSQIAGSGGTFMLNGFNQSVGSLTGSNAITDNSATNVTLTIGSDNSDPATFSGIISNFTQAGSGVLSLTKVGTGNQILQGANTYTGATTITGGVLQASNASAVPPLSALSVGSNTVFLINSVSPSIGSLAGSGTVSSTSGSGFTLVVGNDNTSTTFSGLISNTLTATAGNLGLQKVGTGTLALSGVNTYTGATTIGWTNAITVNTYGGGTLQMGVAGAHPAVLPGDRRKHTAALRFQPELRFAGRHRRPRRAGDQQ